MEISRRKYGSEAAQRAVLQRATGMLNIACTNNALEFSCNDCSKEGECSR